MDPGKVIRSGSVVIHRKGWRSKRRLWLELSHDMLCTYASSSENDRLRPIRTVLCTQLQNVSTLNSQLYPVSAVDKVAPLDPKKPTYLRIIFKSQDQTPSHSGIAEFDTVEAAIDWRKELTGQ